jgi:hypothetical protein
MRARIFLVTGAVGLIAASFLIEACGETETPKTASDAGTADVVVDSAPPKEAAAEEDAATCDLSADFSTQIPDASIADGATTTGICLQCARNECDSELDSCNQDCDCQGFAGAALGCYLENAGASQQVIIQKCGSQFLSVSGSTRQLGLGLVSCLQTNCKTECATDALTPSDAGPDADANM